MKQLMQLRTDQSTFGSYNPLDVKQAAKDYFQKGDSPGGNPRPGSAIVAPNGFDPNGESMFAGHQSEIWKFASNYNPNENIHNYVSETTNVGSLGSINTPEGGLNQGAPSETHLNGHFNANALNSNLMTAIDKHKFKPGLGSSSAFAAHVSAMSVPELTGNQLTGALHMETNFNPNHLNHELFHNLDYSPQAVNSEIIVQHHNSLTGQTQTSNNLDSGKTGATNNYHGTSVQIGGTGTGNHGASENGGKTTNHESGIGITGLQNGGTTTQNGGNLWTGGTFQPNVGTQNSGTGVQNNGGTLNGVTPLAGGTVNQSGGNQNGGTETENGGTVTQNGNGPQAGVTSSVNGETGITGNGENTAGTTGSNTHTSNLPHYHIVLNSKGEHVLVQETETPGKFIVIKTIADEKLANYLIGKLSSDASKGSLAPKSLSAFLSAQLPSTFKKEPSQPIKTVSPFTEQRVSYNGVNGKTPSLQTKLFGTDTAHATGIGKLGDETNRQIPGVFDIGFLGREFQSSNSEKHDGTSFGVVHQVNTNPRVSATGIGSLGSDTLSD